MKRTMSVFLYLLVTCYNMSSVNVVPLPYYVELTDEIFALESGVDYEGFLSGEVCTSIKSIHIGIRHQDKEFDRLCTKLGFFKQEIGDEGYELLIDNKRVVLTANSPRGVFYGKQTLKQLIRGAKNKEMRGLHIIDKPALKYRGVMDDISRGPVPNKEYMKYQIRRMSELKLNMLSYYTEHVVRTTKHPEFAPPAGGISIEEWAELSEYAKKYYVELVPNFQSLGHADKVLLNPKYRHLAESNSMYSPTNPETVLFMKDIYGEMSPAFGSTFFHVNCDETFDLGRGPSKKMADSIGVGRVYANYMNQLSDILLQNNKRMMMWGDIVLQHPNILPLLPKKTVMMTWEYGDQKSFAPWIDSFVENKYDYMVCPGVLNSLRLFPDYKQAIPNIRNFIREGVEKNAMGAFNTVWDDGGLHSFDRDWYGVAYGAEHAWNPNKNELNDFDTRLSVGIYKSEGAELCAAIHKLTELGEIQALDRMSELVFWKTIIPERGKYSSYSLSDWADVYENCVEIDSFLNNKTAQNYTREYAALQLVSDEYKYLANAKLKLAEASALYAKACSIQYQDRHEAKSLLTQARAKIVNCENELSKIRDAFDAIWKSENRDYWNDFALDPFNKIISDYRDLIASFDKSAHYFEQALPLSAPADIRLDIREIDGQYFTYWLISPAFDLADGTGFETDFLKAMGGEQMAAPFPGFSFTDSKGQNIKWMKYSSPLSDRLAWDAALESNQKAIAYAYCTLECAEERAVVASFGMSGSLEIFCNGESVFKKQDNQTMLVDEFQCVLKLKKGRNRILLKTEKGINSWAFSFQIKDQTISSSKNKYRINK